MISSLKFLLINQLKRPKQVQKTSGFTLIELLVGLILAFLILAPLLGFLVNIMETDRKEQAKASSEQELKAALDYMGEDLSQAVYIYDRDSLASISSQLPPAPAATAAGCADATKCKPVLVFWKRENRQNSVPVPPKTVSSCTTPASGSSNPCDDTFVYSLVGYYLITGDSSDSTWSNVSRIARFEISGGVPNYASGPNAPDPGFQSFNLGGTGTLDDKMKKWMKSSTDYSVNFGNNVLIDYIDQSIPGKTPTIPSQMNCDTSAISATDPTPKEQRLPTQDNSVNSFYACVGANNNYARIYIRGNALARLRKNNNTYNPNQTAYFPTATIQVEGNGSLFTK